MTNIEPVQHFLRFPPRAQSSRIHAIFWLVVCLIVIGLGTGSGRFSHELDPNHDIEVEPARLDWTWQSIYPSLGAMAGSQLAFPVRATLRSSITAARAASQNGFERCLTIVRRSRKTLGRDEYKALAKASSKKPAEYFSKVMPDLFAAILAIGVLGVA